MTQEIIDRINCPHQVFKKGNTVKEVKSAYREALKRGKEEGFVPVMVCWL